jgi:N-sulfoglucosamine sulfohydrolase
LREDLARYLDTVQCADACVGAVLGALREAGKYDRTLIIFTSDQGYCYHRAKATAYDMGIHVPLIVRGPGVAGNATNDRLVSHIDLVPTILDCLDIPIPATVQGSSLRPFLEGADVSSWRRYVFAEHNAHGPNPLEYYPIRSVFDGRLHYLRNLTPQRRWDGDPAALLDVGQMPPEVGFAGPADAFPGGPWGNRSYEATVRARKEFPAQYDLLVGMFKRPAEELYDLHDDPYETDNVAGDARYSAHLERLRAALDDWMRRTNDPGVALRTTPRRAGGVGATPGRRPKDVNHRL